MKCLCEFIVVLQVDVEYLSLLTVCRCYTKKCFKRQKSGCKNNQAIWDELYRAEMERAAAVAEAQRGLAAQREAEAKAAEKARQRQECGQKRGSISGSLSGCKSAASSTKSRTYNNCPVEAEVSTGINAGLGNISVITTPRKTCIENADAAYIAAVDFCESIAANALAALPSYCY